MYPGIKNESGNTLIELLTVVGIVSVLIGISYLGINFVRQQRVSSTTHQLLADIQNTRVDAMTSGMTSTVVGYGIRFIPPSSYVSFAWNDNNNDSIYQTGEESGVTTYSLPSSLSLSISSASTPAYTVLVYNRFGFPIRYTGGGDPLLCLSTQDMDIVIQDATTTNAKCVKVTTNSIREGAWSGATCITQ